MKMANISEKNIEESEFHPKDNGFHPLHIGRENDSDTDETDEMEILINFGQLFISLITA